MGILLQQDIVSARGGGIKIPARAGPISGFNHVGVDENAAQAFDAKALDETHAAHVGGEVIDFHRSCATAMAVGLTAYVEAEILHAGNVDIPLVKRLLVHRADVGKTFLFEVKR